MNAHSVHRDHAHLHTAGCGHQMILHEGHTDYLHDGHLHHVHEDHVDEHVLEVSVANPTACTPTHASGSHDSAHRHGSGCGHNAVPHGDHVDYLVDGHLHFAHGTHCDDHGRVIVR